MSSRYCKHKNQKPVSQLKLESQSGTRAVLHRCPSVSKGSCVLMHVHACACMFMHVHACSCVLMQVHACSCVLVHVQLKNFERTHFPSVLCRDQACKRMHHGWQIRILPAKGYNINVFSPHASMSCMMSPRTLFELYHFSPQVEKH